MGQTIAGDFEEGTHAGGPPQVGGLSDLFACFACPIGCEASMPPGAQEMESATGRGAAPVTAKIATGFN